VAAAAPVELALLTALAGLFVALALVFGVLGLQLRRGAATAVPLP
jgi:hypothetical protein